MTNFTHTHVFRGPFKWIAEDWIPFRKQNDYVREELILDVGVRYGSVITNSNHKTFLCPLRSVPTVIHHSGNYWGYFRDIYFNFIFISACLNPLYTKNFLEIVLCRFYIFFCKTMTRNYTIYNLVFNNNKPFSKEFYSFTLVWDQKYKINYTELIETLHNRNTDMNNSDNLFYSKLLNLVK